MGLFLSGSQERPLAGQLSLTPARFRCAILLLLAACLWGCAPVAERPAPSATAGARPNILFIMADDHAWQAVGAYGSRLVKTPHIDRLAAEGIRFDQAFVGNSLCSPSRATLLTGKHSHAHGVRTNIDVFDGSQQTVQGLLRAGGYETAIVGKWHLKSEPTGFDHWEVLPGQGDYYNPTLVSAVGERRHAGYVTDVITDRALAWMAQREDTSRPFLLFFQHKAPHRPWWPSPTELADFTQDSFPEPSTLFDDYRGREAAAAAEMRISDHMGLSNDNKVSPSSARSLGHQPFLDWYERNYRNQLAGMSRAQRKQAHDVYEPISRAFVAHNPRGDELTRWKYQRYLQDYLSTIRSVDASLGRLLDWLEANGQLDNTLVVYTSDQGFYLGEHGWFDKRFMYEESFRTPLIVRWPGPVETGGVRARALVQNIDFAPTLLDVAGLSVPRDMHGQSLAPLFQADDASFREAVYYHYYEYPGIHAVKRHYGVRNQRYKLIHYYHDIDAWEFYDLERDPAELNNVYGAPAMETPAKAARRQLQVLQARFGDSPALAEDLLQRDLRATGH